MMTSATPYFGRGLFEFLTELKSNNNREWFAANKQRYTAEVEEPMLRFIADFGKQVEKISANYVADPRRIGGSMFRIYRDTRFSKDKTPFKTAASAHFQYRQSAKEQSVPGFYLHLEPGLCVGGGGIYHPDPSALKQIRDEIVGNPRSWEAVLATGIPVEGESLKRPPAGYDAEHRFVEHLKRKDFYSMMKFTEEQVCGPDFLDVYVMACQSISPLMKFITQALGLAW